jgi:peroxiredoxin
MRSRQRSIARCARHAALVTFTLIGAIEGAFGSDYAARPEEVRPLLIGAPIPADIPIFAMDGSKGSLAEQLKLGPLVVVFFRQGWCPYCDIQLSELRLIEKDLNALGYRVIAISPDNPNALKARVAKNELTYELFSDSSTALIRAFGIAFDAGYAKSPAEVTRTAEQGVRLMPVPAVFLIGMDGRVQFQYVNPDYRTRIPKDVLLAAAKSSLRTG